MAVRGNKTASYKIVKSEYGNVYQFFCDVSGAKGMQTSPYNESDSEKELTMAWEKEGKDQFNLCHKCGKWVLDVMFNPDVLNCVNCSPIEDIPNYCPNCGEKTNEAATFCHKCGSRLMYGGECDEDK